MSVPAEYSIVLGGRVGVGKSSLFRRLKRNEFSEEPCSSDTLHRWEGGLEKWVYKTTLEGRDVKVRSEVEGEGCSPLPGLSALQVTLWDTGGLEKYTSMTANYFRYCHALLLVYSLEEEDSLYCLNDWVAEACMHNSSDHLLLALWGNKSDSEDRCALKEAVRAFMSVHNIPPALEAHVSARTGEGVMGAFERLVKEVHEQFCGEELPQGRGLEPLIDPQTRKGCLCGGGH